MVHAYAAMPMRQWWRRPAVVITFVIVVLVVVGIVLALFQPWKVWVDHRVDEALPAAATTAATPPATTSGSAVAKAPTNTTLASGSFRSIEHTTTGTASLITLADGSTILRLANLDTSDGPDVHVWLSPKPSNSADDSFAEGHIELGRLKGNQGNQNYVVPAGTNLKSVQSAVIWCKRFTVGFGVAPLTRA